MVAVLAWGVAVAAPARADDTSQCITASERGQQQRDAGKYAQARDSFAQCAEAACPAVVHRDCTRWLSDLTQLQPSVVFGARDPSGNVLVAVRVFADGQPIAGSLDGKLVSIDPGEHLFRFEAMGRSSIERAFVVRAGEKSRLVIAQFGDTRSAQAQAAPMGAAQAAPDAGVPTSAWVFGGLAVAAFGAEAYFGISGLGDRASLESRPCARTATCSASDVTSIRTKFTVADIALGVGIVSGALAAYMYFTRGRAETKDRPAARLDVAPVGGGATATWQASF